MSVRTERAIAAWGTAMAAAAVALAGIVVEDRPVALVTHNLVMHAGRPFVPLSELARALGGSGRYDPVRLRYEIRPGAAGVLLFNPTGLGALGVRGLDGQLHGPAFALQIGGQDVAVEARDHVLLPSEEPAVSLSLLAHLLGGQARFDPGRGAWVLPPGGAGSPLRFR